MRKTTILIMLLKPKIHTFCFVTIILSISLGCKKKDVSPSTETKFDIHSVHTGLDYQITVMYPEKYKKENAYHTVYLLDGGHGYDEAAEIINSEINQDLVLVSIAHVESDNRNTDFTYPVDDTRAKNTGGARKFIQFFNTELIPHIETKIEIIPYERTLYGHSLGGYFSIYFMLQSDYPIPFDNFISASPSLSYGDKYLIEFEQNYFENHTSLNHKWYMSFGSIENNALFNGFMEKMSTRTYTGLQYKKETLKNLGHLNTPFVAFENGLNFILD